MLEDFIDSFRKNDIGLNQPLSTTMYKGIKIASQIILNICESTWMHLNLNLVQAKNLSLCWLDLL